MLQVCSSRVEHCRTWRQILYWCALKKGFDGIRWSCLVLVDCTPELGLGAGSRHDTGSGAVIFRGAVSWKQLGVLCCRTGELCWSQI